MAIVKGKVRTPISRIKSMGKLFKYLASTDDNQPHGMFSDHSQGTPLKKIFAQKKPKADP